jgi:hypothetical protein
MRLAITTIMLACLMNFANAQNSDTPGKATFRDIEHEFNKDVAKTNLTGKNPVTPAVNIELSEDFALSGSIKIPVGEFISILPNFNLGSTNKYTPLFDKGKWAINTSIGLTGNVYFCNRRWFFTNDVENKAQKDSISPAEALANMPISKQSQYQTFWFSVDAKYNYKKYLMLKDSLYPDIEDAFSQIRKSDFLFTLQINGARAFSIKHGVQLKGSLAYTFAVNSNNYEKLEEVKVSKDVLFIDSTGKGIKVSSDESTGRKGNLLFSHGHILTGDIHFTFNPVNTSVGIDIFATPTYTFNKDSKILNIKAGINFAINNSSDPEKSKSFVNIGICVDLKDATTGFANKKDAAQRVIPSLMLGVPLPAIGEK